MNNWDEFEKWLNDLPASVAAVEGQAIGAGRNLAALAAAHDKATRLAQALDACIGMIEGGLSEHLQPVAGTRTYETENGYRVAVSWSERRTWNHDLLEQMLSSLPPGDPAFVDRKIAIDRRMWDQASASERQPFLSALSVKVANRKVIVEAI